MKKWLYLSGLIFIAICTLRAVVWLLVAFFKWLNGYQN